MMNLFSSPRFPENGVGTPILASLGAVVVLSVIVTSAIVRRLYSSKDLKNEATASLGVDSE